MTTRDRTGDPVAATVVLRAVDEKLFGLGGAEAADPLGELYAGVPFGIRARYRSHRAPRGNNDGGGDTTGGGRDDFRDTVLFKSIDTGRDGRASVTFPLSDDLTSWHVSASAIGAGLTAGEGSIQVPVGLPFFADATIASEYLVSDRPEIGLRAFGTALPADARVTFSVDSESLGLARRWPARRCLRDGPRPPAAAQPGHPQGHDHGPHRKWRVGAGGSPDAIVHGRRLASGPHRDHLQQCDRHGARRGRRRPDRGGRVRCGRRPLPATPARSRRRRFSAPRTGTRGASVAASLARDRYNTDPLGGLEFDGHDYQVDDGGLAILPYASSDLDASALAAIIGPDRFDASRLEFYLSTISGNPAETRERRIVALAGLAGLGIRRATRDPGGSGRP